MKDSNYEVVCPCCGAKLEIDAESGVVLEHVAPKRKETPADLRQAVRELDREAGEREEKFRQHFEAEKRHSDELDKKFAGLMKKQKGQKPVKPDWRDIDLD